MKKLKLDRIISIATLIAALVAIVLVLKKPAPVAQPQAPAAIAAHAQLFDEKMSQLQQAAQASQPAPSESSAAAQTSSQTLPSPLPQPRQPAANSSEQPKSEVRLSSDEVGAALAQALGAAGSSALSADSNIGSEAPAIKDQQVSFDGDVVHGQFLTEIAGKDVWVTVSGHLGSQDGYATFEPTEFKVGDLSIPISLVNPALQKKMAEQRDRMKLPDFVGGVKVENGQLVMQQK
ncbi:MAG: hypothetical protein WB562_17350 [Candidatus Sulfotelmatobacter sp.]